MKNERYFKHIDTFPDDTTAPRGVILRIKDLSEIQSHAPFDGSLSQNDSLHTFLDFDGVISLPPYDKKHSQGLKRIQILKSIAKLSDELTIWSGRFMLKTENIFWQAALQNTFDNHSQRNGISLFPFLTRQSQNRIKHFIEHVNPDCEVNFSLGKEKLLRRKTFANSAFNLLKEGKTIAVIGSSIFDRRNIRALHRKIITEQEYETFDRLHCFDTGYLFI